MTDPEKKREALRLWRAKHPMARAEQQRRYRRKVREDVLRAYGGRCYVCGEADLDRLELDHTEGGGNRNRNEIFGYGHQSPGGWMFYLWLREHGYPQDLGLKCICIPHHDEKHGRTGERRRGSPAMDDHRSELEKIPF